MRRRHIFFAILHSVSLGTGASPNGVTRRCGLWSLMVLVCCLQTTVCTASAGSSQQGMASISQEQSGLATYVTMPLSFEPNEGQTDSRVKFLSRGGANTLFLTNEEAVLQLRGSGKEKDGAVLRMKFLGANQRVAVQGSDVMPGKTNYFIGRDTSKWHTNVPTYGKVEYNGIYPGVDLIFYGNQGQLEYDFVLSPGADPDVIALQFDSAADIDSAGDLLLHSAGGDVRFRRPMAYQSISDNEQRGSGNKRLIQSRFVLRESNKVTLEVAPYDHSRPLVIDPVLVYSSYLGGSFPDDPFGITVDSSGSVYVAGLTCSADFPVTAGAYQTAHNGSGGACPTSQNSFEDVFVTKFNSTGTGLVYSTYIGGSGSDRAYGIAIDSSGNAYVAGQTQSKDYPVTAGAFITTCPGGVGGCNTGIVTKLNPTGSALVYSTYVGGNANMGSTGIAVDSSGEAYTTGATDGTFPTTAGAYQSSNPRNGAGLSPVFAILNPSGSACVYCTFLGGTKGTSYNPGNQAFGVAIDSTGKAYITGWTDSSDFPTTAGAFQTTCGTDGNCNGLWDAFVAKLDPTQFGNASLVYSTFLGGSGTDLGLSIAVDPSGDAYVTGITGGNVYTQFGGSPLPSADFPTTAGAFQTTCPGTCTFDSVWVTKLNASGSALVYSTYLGGTNGNTDIATFHGLAVDSALNAYVTGLTTATNFPTQNPTQATNGGGFDAFVSTLNARGSALSFSTYLGGNSTDQGTSIAVDKFGNMYVTGTTSSADFPVTAGGFETTCPGSCTYYHGFVSKIGRFYSSTSLGSSLNPSMFNQSVTFTAMVSPAPIVISRDTAPTAVPTGSVAFRDGTTTLGTAPLTNGSATFTTSALSTGTHSMVGAYSGDSNFVNSLSATLAQVVNKDSSNTSIASSSNPAQWGATVTFTATVTTPTGTVPTGTMTFMDGTTTLGTSALSGGTTTLVTNNLAVGVHSITAVYGGDANTVGSTSLALTQMVTKATTTVTLTVTPNPSQFNQKVSLTAAVTSATGAIPTGNVTFKDGATILKTVSLSSGAATLSVSKLAVGTHSITAIYNGSIDFAAGTSPAVDLTVNMAKTTTKLTSTPNPSTSGQAVTFTATITGAFGGSPTGTVTFTDGTTVIGTGNVSTTTRQATFVTSTLSVGTHTITATYNGDSDYLTSKSAGLKQVVE